MSRKPRIWFPGAMYHITSRGNRRADIFNDVKDRFVYLSILQETAYEFPFILHAYCLMTNHIHLLIETKEHHSKDIMKKLHSLYAIYFNRRHELSGHVFQGRYHASLVRNASYFLEVSKYIHLNPYMASIVAHPTDYHWSSYHDYVHSSSSFIETEKVLSFFPNNSAKLYQLFVETEVYEGQNLNELNKFYQLYFTILSKQTDNEPLHEEKNRQPLLDRIRQ